MPGTRALLMSPLVVLSLALLLVVPAPVRPALAAEGAAPANGAPEYGYPPVPVAPSAGPDAVKGLLSARPFTLETPYTYTFTAEQAAITRGWLLVVEVEKDLAQLRDAWNSVLYVGRYPAEITDSDAETGRMIVLVPADVNLTRDAIFFGSQELPERVDAARGQLELAAAVAAGYRPVRPEILRLALRAGGESITVHDGRALYAGPVADLIDQYAPSDAAIAESFRAPLVGPR